MAEPNVDFSERFSEESLEEVRKRRLLIDRLDAWLFSMIEPYLGQRVLEIGSGHGNIVRHLVDREHVVATDVDAGSVEIVRERFGDRGNVESVQVDASDVALLELADRDIDTIVSLNVFEHIEDDRVAMEHCFSILRPGGRLILIVPAHRWLYGDMDSSIGHWRRYDKGMMAERLRHAGFDVERQSYINALGTLGWFVNGRLLGRKVPPTGQLKLFNVVVPIIEWSERIAEPPIGLSLLAIGRRPGGGE